ncbi:MAG: vWA domain-containing protein [Planctomycetota bacterium]
MHRFPVGIHSRRAHGQRRGAMLVLVAIVLVILLIGAFFSVDVAYMHMVRAELRTATDAAARAASETLARTQNQQAAIDAAVAIADRNEVAGNGLTLTRADIQLGTVLPASSGRFEFRANQAPFTAVSVNGRRGSTAADGPVGLFFGRLFNADSFAPSETAIAAASVRDIALVLDVSGSMNAGSGSGTRLTALKEAVRVFLAEIAVSSPSSQVSLTVYSTQPTKLVNLTNNFGQIQSQVNNLQARGLTAIGNGLSIGSDSLVNDPAQRAFALKTILVMTDGNHNRGPSPLQTVNTAIARDQQVHTVTFSAGANQSLMSQVAQATSGGIHLHADNGGDLAAAFRDIARSLAVVLVE